MVQISDEVCAESLAKISASLAMVYIISLQQLAPQIGEFNACAVMDSAMMAFSIDQTFRSLKLEATKEIRFRIASKIANILNEEISALLCTGKGATCSKP